MPPNETIIDVVEIFKFWTLNPSLSLLIPRA